MACEHDEDFQKNVAFLFFWLKNNGILIFLFSVWCNAANKIYYLLDKSTMFKT